ncbi:MAG: helix-turn-helix domain-containing protein [Xanthobacteraceae bacterium]|nr:helix-turn-helix domain-containing protein [Xanthobacteraceae bacterium]
MPRWTTQDVPEDQQFGYWREVLCEAFITLDPRRTRSRDVPGFAGDVTANMISEVNVTSLIHEAHLVRRGPAEIRKRPLEYYFVNMQIQGEVLAMQRGRQVLIRPNEFYIVDSTEPYDLDYRSKPETYSFRIPKAMLDPLLVDASQLTATRVSRVTPMGRLAIEFLQSMLRQPEAIPATASDSVANMITEMVALSLGGNPRARELARVRGSARAVLLNSILRFVDTNLLDPRLSVEAVCRRFGISPRYLHKVFEAAALSFGDEVRTRRLQFCASELSRAPDRPISAIALSSGFSDISHFNHCFRAHFGVSPREYRRAARSGPLQIGAPVPEKRGPADQVGG